jgi:hypothetical protein
MADTQMRDTKMPVEQKLDILPLHFPGLIAD